MNRSVVDAQGAVQLVSQFTLHADARRGRRPSFAAAAAPAEAVPLLEEFKRRLEALGLRVPTGRFGAHMRGDLLNDGPVTILLDSEDRGGGASETAIARDVDGRPHVDPDANDHAGRRLRFLGPGSPLERLPLVLASASPRRRDLLRDLGVPFTIQAADVDELTGVPDEPEEHCGVVAERKARAIMSPARDELVLAADTIVVVDGGILGKPVDEADAVRMLTALAGRTHDVKTALCVARASRDRFLQSVVTTRVRFRPLADAEIARNVATGEPFGKAGAYAIKGVGALLVHGIEGDYSNVVGLPLGTMFDLMELAVLVGPR
jgi:septum formation protein